MTVVSGSSSKLVTRPRKFGRRRECFYQTKPRSALSSMKGSVQTRRLSLGDPAPGRSESPNSHLAPGCCKKYLRLIEDTWSIQPDPRRCHWARDFQSCDREPCHSYTQTGRCEANSTSYSKFPAATRIAVVERISAGPPSHYPNSFPAPLCNILPSNGNDGGGDGNRLDGNDLDGPHSRN